MKAAPRLLRAGHTLLAWCCAVYACVWSGFAVEALADWWRFPPAPPPIGRLETLFSTTFGLATFGAIFGAPGGFAAIAAIRRFAWPRPAADAAFAAATAVSGAALFFAVSTLIAGLTGRLSDAELFEQARYGLEIVWSMLLMLVAGGAIGGLVYWFVAGRPAPPYR